MRLGCQFQGMCYLQGCTTLPLTAVHNTILHPVPVFLFLSVSSRPETEAMNPPPGPADKPGLRRA